MNTIRFVNQKEGFMAKGGQHRLEKKRNMGSAQQSIYETFVVSEQSGSTILVDDSKLHGLQPRPKFLTYLKQIWRRRFFIWSEAKSKSLKDGQDMFLGNLWIILNPLIQVGIYALVFGMILKTSRGMENFIGFLVIGVIYFGFLSRGINSGVGLIKAERGMITSFQFPKASLVISHTVRQFVDNAPAAIIGICIALLFQPHKLPTWSLLLVPPLYFLLHIFNAGAAFFIARSTAFVPDLRGIVNLMMRGLFFVSGVFFSIDRFDGNPKLKHIVELNPLYQYLSAFRTCVLEGQSPSLHVWLYLTVWSVSLFCVGLIYFWRAEERYASVK
ncbi:ABC transporter permease [Corynebacterium sp. HMSC062E11]|uniref:ABC transporter permease n=1 Tax=Corynebacterium sp. HMSC062E11 TaxID=1739326 RepID=UPI00130108E2|nr:ABC transporter permease [Corynebacterium sp. HMSC062E11]